MYVYLLAETEGGGMLGWRVTVYVGQWSCDDLLIVDFDSFLIQRPAWQALSSIIRS